VSVIYLLLHATFYPLLSSPFSCPFPPVLLSSHNYIVFQARVTNAHENCIPSGHGPTEKIIYIQVYNYRQPFTVAVRSKA
jgi:hypothetical protein